MVIGQIVALVVLGLLVEALFGPIEHIIYVWKHGTKHHGRNRL